MKAFLLLCAAMAALAAMCHAESGATTESEILALERQAMDGWLKGDPDPTLAISDPELTYYHVMTGTRLDGLAAVRKLYEQYRGTPLFDSYGIEGAKVQVAGEVAVLTYRLARRNGSATSFWNATQVYRRKGAAWKIIHTHWSRPQPNR